MTQRHTPSAVRAAAEAALGGIPYAAALRAAPADRPAGMALEGLALVALAARRIQALKAAPRPWVYAAEDILAMQCVLSTKGGMDTARAKRWLRDEAEPFAQFLKSWRAGDMQ